MNFRFEFVGGQSIKLGILQGHQPFVGLSGALSSPFQSRVRKVNIYLRLKVKCYLLYRRRILQLRRRSPSAIRIAGLQQSIRNRIILPGFLEMLFAYA